MAWVRTMDANNYLKSYRSISNGNYIINSAVDSSMVMDVYAGNTVNGTNIQLHKYNGGEEINMYCSKCGEKLVQ